MSPRKKAKMLASFDAFSARINQAYKDAATALHEDDYVKAHNILSELAISHAKTSLSLRNMLVQEGLLPK